MLQALVQAINQTPTCTLWLFTETHLGKEITNFVDDLVNEPKQKTHTEQKIEPTVQEISENKDKS